MKPISLFWIRQGLTLFSMLVLLFGISPPVHTTSSELVSNLNKRLQLQSKSGAVANVLLPTAVMNGVGSGRASAAVSLGRCRLDKSRSALTSPNASQAALVVFVRHEEEGALIQIAGSF